MLCWLPDSYKTYVINNFKTKLKHHKLTWEIKVSLLNIQNQHLNYCHKTQTKSKLRAKTKTRIKIKIQTKTKTKLKANIKVKNKPKARARIQSKT